MAGENPHADRLAEIEQQLVDVREAMSRTKTGEGSINQLEADIAKLETERDALIAAQNDV